MAGKKAASKKNNEGRDEEISDQNIFTYRMVNASCTYGCMLHPLNVDAKRGGHGVVYGSQSEPILNANDFVPDIHVMHFGDCSPKKMDVNYNVVEAKTSLGRWLNNALDFVFDTGKCSPMIEKVWFDTNGKYLIDGAPVLLTRSILFCKRGGVIKIELEVADEESSENVLLPDEVDAHINAVMAETNTLIDQAVKEGKIDQQTAEYMEEGYQSSLIFANGDVEEANKLFTDLLRYGNNPRFGMDTNVAYENSGTINDQFVLFLKHNQSPLLEDCNSEMGLTNASSGEQMQLRDVVQVVASNNQRVMDTMDGDGNPKNSTMTKYAQQMKQNQIISQSITAYGQRGQGPGVDTHVTAPYDPNDPFANLGDDLNPRWYSECNITSGTVRVVDEVAGNRETPIVTSILNGLS